MVGQAPSSSVVSRGFPSASFHTVVVEHLRTERSAGTCRSVRSPLRTNQFSSSIAVTVNVSVDSVAFSDISPGGMPPSIWTGPAMVQLSSTGTSKGAAGIQAICPRMPLTTLSPRRWESIGVAVGEGFGVAVAKAQTTRMVRQEPPWVQTWWWPGKASLGTVNVPSQRVPKHSIEPTPSPSKYKSKGRADSSYKGARPDPWSTTRIPLRLLTCTQHWPGAASTGSIFTKVGHTTVPQASLEKSVNPASLPARTL